MHKDSALRAGPFLDQNQQRIQHHVVHGSYDDFFCKNQQRWNNIPGLKLHILPDNHVFLSSLRELAQILTEMVAAADARSRTGRIS
jgi:hypothetical protein